MNEFVTLCGRDRVPIVWFQDTTGIDVGDIAEKAELLGLGQSLIYSIQQTDVPMMLVVLRKGSAAAHYIMGGPTANRHNAFTLGTAATEIYVMHGETAAVATYARRAVKDKDAGKPLQPIADKMNEMAKKYYDTSRPDYCAQHGFVDEIVDLDGAARLSESVRRRGLPEPEVDLPAPPDAAAAHHQGLMRRSPGRQRRHARPRAQCPRSLNSRRGASHDRTFPELGD